MENLKVIKITDEANYVRIVSTLFPGGLTKAEMKIIILLLTLYNNQDEKVITQQMKERVRISLDISSQTMHNYWAGLRKKKAVIGKYKDYTFNDIFIGKGLVVKYDVG